MNVAAVRCKVANSLRKPSVGVYLFGFEASGPFDDAPFLLPSYSSGVL